MRRGGLLQRLHADRRGVTIIEFAMTLPVTLTLIMGLGELTYRTEVQSILTGAMQKAGRDSTIQNSTAATIDAAVMAQVLIVAGNATYTSSRKSYTTFGYVAPEPFTDSNGNGQYDKGECFSDINGNGVWDSDPGITGQGGANDAVVYTMTVTYPHLFPVAKWFGWGAQQTISATTILKNQPYAAQAVSSISTICT